MATTNKVKTIGVLTSGGDAPGMNAAIRAAVRRGLQKGVQMKGILKGYDGLMNEEIIDMTARDVSDTIERGGTIPLYRPLRRDAYTGRPENVLQMSAENTASTDW